MENEFDVPCRGEGGEACAEVIHYKRQPLKGSWRSLIIYLTCKNGHTNAYEIPAQGGTTGGTAETKTPPPRSTRRAHRHER